MQSWSDQETRSVWRAIRTAPLWILEQSRLRGAKAIILAVNKHPVCILRMILQKTLAALSLLGTELERPQTNFDEFQKLVQVENSTKCFEQISGTTCTSLGQEAKLLMKLRLGLSASGKPKRGRMQSGSSGRFLVRVPFFSIVKE